MKNLRRYNRQERFSLAEAVAECGLRSVLRHFVRRKTIAFVAVVVVPRKSDIEVYRKAAESLLHETLPVSDILETCVRVVRDEEEANAKATASSINSHERTIVLVPSENLLTERLELAADVVVAVSEPSARHFLAGAFRLGVPGLTMKDAEYLAGLDLDQISSRSARGGLSLTASSTEGHAANRKGRDSCRSRPRPDGSFGLRRGEGMGPATGRRLY